jgi:hypothetical protein
MAEVLVQFDSAVKDPSGRGYIAKVCGRETEDGLWEGWIEFDAGDGSPVLRTPRETTQPKRTDIEYWAGGLTATYLEGALRRAMDPETPDLRLRTVAAKATYEAPATRADQQPTAVSSRPVSTAILDPFAVYAQGEDLLRSELGALDESHLRNIARVYELADDKELDLQAMHRVSLVELIVAAVRRRIA